MWRYVLKRIGLALVTVFIILTLTFLLMKLLPFQKPLSTSQEEMYAYYMHQVYQKFVYVFNSEQYHLGDLLWKYDNPSDRATYYFYEVPIFTQYFAWLKNIITRWEWGVSTSIKLNNSALSIITDRLPVTIKINIISVIVSVPLGILFGIIAALNKNKPVDHFISTVVMVFISIPSFVMITFLLLILGYQMKLVPTKWPLPTDPMTMQMKGYILPVICLSFGSICGYTRFTRAELCEVMSSEYLLLARTKGLTKRQAIIRHALRNSMVPIVPSIVAEFIGVLFGSMILESLYSIPGIGSLYIEAINKHDYNVLFVNICVFTTIGLLSGVLVDISYGFIDPRIRMGAKK